MVSGTGIGTRFGRVLIETLLIVWFLVPLYEDARNSNPQFHLPPGNSLTAVFAVTLLLDFALF